MRKLTTKDLTIAQAEASIYDKELAKVQNRLDAEQRRREAIAQCKPTEENAAKQYEEATEEALKRNGRAAQEAADQYRKYNLIKAKEAAIIARLTGGKIEED